MFRGRTGITETVVFDLHSVKCSLGKFFFRNSQWNPCLNPKLKFSVSRTVLTLKFKILIIYRACHFSTGSLLAAAECVLWLSLQHEPASAAGHGTCKPLLECLEWGTWEGRSAASHPLLVSVQGHCAEQSKEGAVGRLTSAKGANRASEAYLSFRILWISM